MSEGNTAIEKQVGYCTVREIGKAGIREQSVVLKCSE